MESDKPKSLNSAASTPDPRGPETATPDSRNPATAGSTPGFVGILNPVGGTVAIPLPRGLLGSAGGLVIGRATDICHVVLDDPTVSRRHTRLRLADGTLMVEDLNSATGTRLDGAPLEPFRPQSIDSGQTLKMAGLSYTIDIA